MTVFTSALDRLLNPQNPDGSQRGNIAGGETVNNLYCSEVPSYVAVGLSNMTTPPQRVVSGGVVIKRGRDPSLGQMSNYYGGGMESSNISFGVDSVTPLIQRQQMEIDSLIEENHKKLRMEIAGRQAEQGRRLVTAVREESSEKLRIKEEETWRMGRDVMLLQQKVTGLMEDNRLLKESNMAHEATINSLNLKLMEVLTREHRLLLANAVAESHCGGSNNIVVDVDHAGGYGLEQGGDGGDDDDDDGGGSVNQGGYGDDGYNNQVEGNINNNNITVKCKMCREREATFVMLPCNHLCFCSVCVIDSPYLCPVCDELMDSNGALPYWS